MLDELLEAIRSGESRSLLLRGEAGIGKTPLLEYLIASASELTVARAVGVESEMELAYASLHQLCAQLPDRLEELPAPQQDALRIAFGLTRGTSPDRFLVGLAVLSLMSEVAEERPLLCVVDDAQWLDQASAQTLAFVAGRLFAEPLGLVFCRSRAGRRTRARPRARVGDARVAARPDIGRAGRRSRRCRCAGVAGADRGQLRAQARALPSDARRLLLVAAAEPLGDPLLLWRAAGRLGIDIGVAQAIEGQGLLAIDERVTFRHPLVRSAIYRSVPVDERRAVHLALAEATSG